MKSIAYASRWIDKYLAIEGIRHVKSIGVAILPGLTAGTWSWRYQLPVFEKYALKLHEMKEALVAHERFDGTMESALGLSCTFVDSLPSPIILAGNSMGALLALEMAVLRPDKVIAVIASGAPGMGETNSIDIRGHGFLTLDFAHAIKRSLFFDSTRLDDQLLETAFRRVATAQNLFKAVKILRAVKGKNSRTLLPRISCPTTLIWGREDSVCPPNPWKSASEGLKMIEFHEIDRSGHCPMFETPEAFNSIMNSFLAKTLVGNAADPLLATSRGVETQ